MNYVYLMWTPYAPLRCKIGYSNNPKDRAAEIAKSLPRRGGRVYIVSSARIIGAYGYEQFLHLLFSLFRAPLRRSISGYSEFFWLPVMPIAFLLVELAAIVQLLFIAALVYGFTYIYHNA